MFRADRYGVENPAQRQKARRIKYGVPGTKTSDEVGFMNVKPCCDEHDKCYGCEGKAAGKSKRRCDFEFCICVLFKNIQASPALPPLNALTYCYSVILFGDDAFKKGRL
ncbi:MAG: hypothetical protein FJ240_03060 [Nitrospira sp.]|nr:hypothetical protein [Nitrospira sp.]